MWKRRAWALVEQISTKMYSTWRWPFQRQQNRTNRRNSNQSFEKRHSWNICRWPCDSRPLKWQITQNKKHRNNKTFSLQWQRFIDMPFKFISNIIGSNSMCLAHFIRWINVWNVSLNIESSAHNSFDKDDLCSRYVMCVRLERLPIKKEIVIFIVTVLWFSYENKHICSQNISESPSFS